MHRCGRLQEQHDVLTDRHMWCRRKCHPSEYSIPGCSGPRACDVHIARFPPSGVHSLNTNWLNEFRPGVVHCWMPTPAGHPISLISRCHETYVVEGYTEYAAFTNNLLKISALTPPYCRCSRRSVHHVPVLVY